MRKLLFLLPFLAGGSLAQGKANETNYVLVVPTGATSILLNMEGGTRQQALLSGQPRLTIKISVDGQHVSTRFEQRSAQSHSNLLFIYGHGAIRSAPMNQTEVVFRPSLNRWQTVWEGTQVSGWTVKSGGKRNDTTARIALQVLFSSKAVEKIPANLQPPRLP